MEAQGINWPLLLLQLVNLAMLITWIILAVFALRQLRQASVGGVARVLWAALILLVPVFGAAAFLLVRAQAPDST
jgi:uncharacterized membrane protein